MRHTLSATLAATGLVVGLAACAGDNNVGLNHLDVTSVADTFQWLASDLNGATQRFTYTWQNTGVVATVTQASTITAGVASLTIKDADGVQVFLGNLANNGTFDTDLGTTGSWTIDLVLTGASGSVNFRVERKP